MHHCDITKTITITKESSSLSLSISPLLFLYYLLLFFVCLCEWIVSLPLHPPFLVFFSVTVLK
jgi:hypothetical protein